MDGGDENAYKVLVANPEGKRQLRRPRGRQEGNIKMEITAIGLESVD
jgi:hypothetical protein